MKQQKLNVTSISQNSLGDKNENNFIWVSIICKRHGKNKIDKVGCIFPMVISSEFRMGTMEGTTIGKTHPTSGINGHIFYLKTL